MAWSSLDIEKLSLALAEAFLLGEWSHDSMLNGVKFALGRTPPWTDRLATVLFDTYRERPADRPRELAHYIEILVRADIEARYQDDDEDDDWDEDEWFEGELPSRPAIPKPEPLPRLKLPHSAPKVRRYPIAPLEMIEYRWPVAVVNDVQELADFLGVAITDLLWLADPRSMERSADDDRLRNYHYAWIPRRSGTPRLIEAPKPWLKKLQRRVLHRMLDPIPPHEAAHGFRRGHSAVTNARRHAGASVVLRFDLEDFFAAVSAGRVFGIFRTAGYPEPVAHLLTALCTNAAPPGVLDNAARSVPPEYRHRLRARLASPHLPQGAPTSPALANLVAYRLDVRLSNFATRLGGTYSRYADDVTISGDRRLVQQAGSLRHTITDIIREEGFRPNENKSQLMTRAGRQTVTGIIVNEHPNIARSEYDTLKAVIHEAVTRGPAAANRSSVPDFRSHLLGKIAWVGTVNPAKGHKLRERFERITWP